MSNSPLGNNTNWVVSSDHMYISRELDRAAHDALAYAAVLLDAELSGIQERLGERVILALKVGKRTIHVRIYLRDDVERRPDRMASRMAYMDTDCYVGFGHDGQLTYIEGELRGLAQGHAPKYYGQRGLTSERVMELDKLQDRIKGDFEKTKGWIMAQAQATLMGRTVKPTRKTHEPEPA